MNTAAPPFTPLESLLLFQSVLQYGIGADAFAQISARLQNNSFVKSDTSYDASRLSAESLQQLFLRLLQDELRFEQHGAAAADHTPTATPSVTDASNASNGAAPAAAGSLSPTPKKRKLAKPPLPTMKDVFAHADKLPILVERLYARYRDCMVESIREEERQAERIRAEIRLLEAQEVEAARRAAALQSAAAQSAAAAAAGSTPLIPAGANGKTPTPPAVSSPQSAVSAGKPASSAPAVAVPANLAASAAAKPPSTSPQQNAAPQPLAAAGTARPTPKTPGHPPTATTGPQNGAATPATTALPQAHRPHQAHLAQQPQQAQQPQKPPLPQQPHAVPLPKLEPASARPGVPHPTAPQGQILLPVPQPTSAAPQAGQGVPVPTAKLSGQTAPGLPHPNVANAAKSPNPQQAPQQPHQRPVQAQPGPPQHAAGQVPQTAPVAAQLPQTATTADKLPTPVPGNNLIPHPPKSLPQLATAHPPHTRPENQRAPSTAVSTPTTASPPITAAPASKPEQKAHLGHQHAPPTNAVQPATAVAPTGLPPSLSTRPSLLPEHVVKTPISATPTPTQSPRPILPHTPVHAVSAGFIPRGSGTRWKHSEPTPSTPGPETGDMDSPAYEPLSPVHPSNNADEDKHLAEESSGPAAHLRNSRPPKRLPLSKTAPKIELPASRPRGRPPRHPRHEDTDDDVHPKVKHEVATPATIADTEDTATEDGVARTSEDTRGSPRPSRALKRKRDESVEFQSPQKFPPKPRVIEEPIPPTHVLWMRGFPKISASALDQISSHRHANMFAHKIRDRDAPGYGSIVQHPVDLKSIRMAITQGNKAAMAAVALLLDVEHSASSVWLPISEELVPPKGIINSSQLECELVHMFANAIMYNPDSHRGPGPGFMAHELTEEDTGAADSGNARYKVDEDGVVNDTRDMYVEVEKLLSDMRSAEKQSVPPPPPDAKGIGMPIDAEDQAMMTDDDTPEHHTGDDGHNDDEAPGQATDNEDAGTSKRRRITRAQQ